MYPGAYDAMPDPGANLSTTPTHSTQHNAINDAIEAMQAELGLTPSGSSATVAARFAVQDTAIGSLQLNGVRTFANTAARDAAIPSPAEGTVLAYLSDVDVYCYYNGTAWVELHRGTAQLSHDPLVNQSANVTYSKTRTGYLKTGRRVEYDFNLTCTSAGSAGTDIAVELPFIAATNQVGGVIGQGFVFDTSATATYPAFLVITSTTYAKFMSTALYGAAITYIGGAGLALTLASGDVLRGSGRYEAAS